MFRARDPKVELLRDLPLFKGLRSRDLRRLSALADLADVAEGHLMTTQDRFGLEFFVIVEGTATVTRDGVALAELGPGDFFGELALIDRAPRSATVRARTPMKLVVIHANAFATLLTDHATVGARILEVMRPRIEALAAA